ncbi:hypothetical protein BKA60DRAFT_529043, partial [Fusarium oxysporum]
MAGQQGDRTFNNHGLVVHQAGRDVNINTTADFNPSFFKTSNYEAQKNINPVRVKDTCKWFLEHPTFRKWRESDHNDLLWLSADPACGKSVLAKALIDENLVVADHVKLCYFFFKDNEEQNSAPVAICALLHQLFCAEETLLQKHASQAERRNGHALKSDFEELWKLFVSTATDPDAGETVCILDALDECKKSDRDQLIAKLYQFHTRSRRTKSRVKFLVTSRPYDSIEQEFSELTEEFPTIRLRGEVESEKISEEISLVAKENMKKIGRRLGLLEEVESALLQKLSTVPSRTYLWLHLITKRLQDSLSRMRRDLLKVIEELPETLEQAYEDILKNCPQRAKALEILQIIVAAQRPLTLGEIDITLAVDSNSTSETTLELRREGTEKYIRRACGLFVTVVGSRAYLIHQTAKEFLLQQENKAPERLYWRGSIDEEKAHRQLSEICIIYLLLPEFNQRDLQRFSNTDWKKYCQDHVFLEYSANHWISHAQKAITGQEVKLAKKALQLCDIGNGSSSTWFQLLCSSVYLEYSKSTYSTPPSPLYWSALFGLEGILQLLLRNPTDVNLEGGYFGNALQAAAYGGHKQVVSQLLAAGAEMNSRAGMYNTALQAAASRGHTEVVCELLTYGIVNSVSKTCEVTEGAVIAAAENESGGKDVIKALLKYRGGDLPVTEEVVRAAAGNERSGKDVMTVLLESRGGDLPITEEVVKAAAGNERSGKDVMT